VNDEDEAGRIGQVFRVSGCKPILDRLSDLGVYIEERFPDFFFGISGKWEIRNDRLTLVVSHGREFSKFPENTYKGGLHFFRRFGFIPSLSLFGGSNEKEPSWETAIPVFVFEGFGKDPRLDSANDRDTCNGNEESGFLTVLSINSYLISVEHLTPSFPLISAPVVLIHSREYAVQLIRMD
jgi:hypothetical protein